jgi:hypothetical protein
LNRAAARRSAIILAQAVVLCGLLSCAARVFQPVNVNGPVELAPDEALLIVHVDTDVAIHGLILNSRPVAQSLRKGQHVWMIRVREGSYRWKMIELGNQQRHRMKYRLESDEELRFEVKAGEINYPGELIVRSDSMTRSAYGALFVRNLNHSAMAMRALRGSYDSVLRSLPLRYAGLEGDAFLEYYARERDRVESRAETP